MPRLLPHAVTRALLPLLVSAVVPAAVHAATPAPWGDLDGTYGTDGRATAASGDPAQRVGDVKLDPAGQAVVSSTYASGGVSQWLLSTFTTAGAVDSQVSVAIPGTSSHGVSIPGNWAP